MDLEFCLSGQQFSLDILVIKLSELFHSRDFCQILRLVLMLVEKILILRLLKGRGEGCPCGGGRRTLNGSFPRGIRTSLGTVSLPFRRVARIADHPEALRQQGGMGEALAGEVRGQSRRRHPAQEFERFVTRFRTLTTFNLPEGRLPAKNAKSAKRPPDSSWQPGSRRLARTGFQAHAGCSIQWPWLLSGASMAS